MRRRVPDLLALAFLALLALIFFWPVTLNLGWIPHGGGDLVSLLWPHYSYAAQSLHAGRWPLWNSALFSGAPFAGDNQTSLFYPINLLLFLLVPSLPYRAVEWQVVLHFWVAGASMYGCLRVLLDESTPPAVGRPSTVLPALFSAVAYMFSDLFITHIGNLNLNAAAAWLPAVFAGLYLALKRQSPGWAAATGALWGLSILAGMAQMSFICAIGLGLYALWEVAGTLIGSGPDAVPVGARLNGALRIVALAGLAAVIAAGLSAVTLIPSAELTANTTRVRLEYSAAASYSIPWAGLAGLFSPLIFGRGPAFFWGPWERVELGYLGVLPLFFAGLASFKGRRSTTVFLAGLAFFGLLVALGPNTPFHRLLYYSVPGFAQMRVPARYILLTDFALAALAGYGLHRLAAVRRRQIWLWGAGLLVAAVLIIYWGYDSTTAMTGTPRADALRLGLIIAGGLLLLGLVLAGWLGNRPRPYVAILSLALLVVDLIGQGAWVEVDRNDPTVGFQHPQAVAFLQSQPGPTRIDSASGAWTPSAAARLGLEAIDGVNHALVLARYQTYLWSVGARGTPLYNFLNAQFVIADKDHPPADDSFVPVYNEDPAVDVYLNTNAMPRLSLVYAAEVVPDGEAAFAAIHVPDFDPASTVVVEGDAPVAGGRAPEGASNLFYLTYGPEAYTVIAQNPAPAYLVFSEVWYPGWRAWVDGVEAPIYIANFAFRAVYLPTPGEHTVTMRFEPLSLRLGAGITLATVLGLSLWLVLRVGSPKSSAPRQEHIRR